MESINFITFIQDRYIFWLFQGLLIIFTLVGILTEFLNSNSGKVVTRGAQSRNIFYIIYGILSVVFLAIIQVTSQAREYKVFITIVDLLLLMYLCFFNSWSRNKIMGLYIKFESKVEKL